MRRLLLIGIMTINNYAWSDNYIWKGISLRMPNNRVEDLLIAALVPLLLYALLHFTNKPKKYQNYLFYLVSVEYFILLFYFALIDRKVIENLAIHRDLFWGYQSLTENTIQDNIINIIIFIPIGILLGFISKKLLLMKSLLVGLFISESIECSQLIFMRGNFDVDDLFNNTVGAVIGAVVFMFVSQLWTLLRKKFSLK